jgi:hypothetical protein
MFSRDRMAAAPFHRRCLRLTAESALGAIVTAAVLAGSPAGVAAARNCPREVASRPASIGAVIGAARRLLITGRTVDVQGRTYRLNVHDNAIVAVVNLGPIPAGMNAPDPRAYRQLAAARCGRRTAARSWAVVWTYPQTIVASFGIRVDFVVLTKRGWRSY